MGKRVKYIAIGIVAALTLIIVMACSSDLTPLEERIGQLENDISQIVPAATTKQFYLTGVEWKGTTTATELAPPSVDPTTLSSGYGFKGPGVLDSANPDKWQVATYVFTPATMVVNEGDTVDLTTFIVNGDLHSTRMIAPDGSQVGETIVMNRGREYKFSFDATQSGVYTLVCDTHAPTMTAKITALPTT